MNKYLKVLLGTTCLTGLSVGGAIAAPTLFGDFSNSFNAADNVTGMTSLTGSLGVVNTPDATASVPPDLADYFRLTLALGKSLSLRLSAIGNVPDAVSADTANFPDAGASDPKASGSEPPDPTASGSESSPDPTASGSESSPDPAASSGSLPSPDPTASDSVASGSAPADALDGTPDPVFASFSFDLFDSLFDPAAFIQNFDADGAMLIDVTGPSDGTLVIGLSNYTGGGGLTYTLEVSGDETSVPAPGGLGPIAAGAAMAGGLSFLRRRRRKRAG